MDEVTDRLTRLFEFTCRFFGKGMNAAVYVGIESGVVGDEGIDDPFRLLVGRGVVEVNQVAPVYLLVENGKFLSYLLNLEGFGGFLRKLHFIKVFEAVR